MTKRMHHMVAMGMILLLTACSGNKSPADEAIKSAQSSYDAVKSDAQKYVPDQANAIETSLISARASYDKGDYDAAMATAKDATAKINPLTGAIASKKEDLARNWTELSVGVPKMVAAIQSRVDVLSKSKSLPAGLDKAAFDSAKSGLEDMNKMWSDASADYQSGNVADAVAKAEMVKDHAASIMTTLGMQVPAAASRD